MGKTLAAAASAFTLAALIAGTGLTAASASAAAGRTEEFRMVSGQVSGKASVVATGAFTAGGTTNLNTTAATLRFSGGSFRINPRPTQTHVRIDPRTCVLNAIQQGTYRIGHGTGRFAHVTGSGTYAAELLGVLVRNARGKCSQSRPPRALQQVVTAHGPVSGA
jgi:TRAP-type mannitol/chloroaromatic compound transport system substrate-binding protein